MIELGSHFRDTERFRLREWHRRQHLLEQSRRDAQTRREEAAEELESDLLAAAGTILATPQEIESFTIKLDEFETRLDTYNKASVAALMQKQAELEDIEERLEQIREKKADMQKNAFVMDDGTRIFLGPDGSYAIDVEGNDVPLEKVPVEAVPKRAWIADKYSDILQFEQDLSDAKETVEGEISAIHRFDKRRNQSVERAEEIRSEINKGDLTKERIDELGDELDQMDKDLLQAMPPSVRAQVPGLGLDADTPNMKVGFENAVTSVSSKSTAPAPETVQPSGM